MTYAVKDKSIHSGAPIECYEFVAAHKTWRLTSYHKPITVDGDLYTPLPITRTALETTSVIDTPVTMDFNIPASHELAKTFCYTVSPRNLLITVKRVHEGDDYETEFKVEWSGKIVGTSGNDEWGVIKSAPIIQSDLNAYLSSVYYQKSCNHDLFDVRCKVLRSDYTVSANVVKIQGQIITVDDMVFANDELVLGSMTNTRTGEAQGIVSNNAGIIKLGYPFFDIMLGDSVELTLGCDHQRLGHCKTRFSNTVNYGGFDFIPEINPFAELVYTTSTKTVIDERGKVVPAMVTGGGSVSGYGGSGVVGDMNPSDPGGVPKKPKPAASRSTTFETDSTTSQGSIPQASIGNPVTAILGRKRVANSNLIWTGNLRPLIETIETPTQVSETTIEDGYQVTKTTTTIITTTTVVGYLCDMQFGVCLGPNVELIGVYSNNELLWSGTLGPALGSIVLPTNNTFLSGATLKFTGGAFNQAKEADIVMADYPGYVGIATVFIKGARADIAPGSLSFEVRRIPNPLALSNAVNRTGDDLNTMSALVEVITNGWGYGGVDISNVDTVTLSAIAAVLKAEGNVCSIKIDNEAGINEIIAALQDQMMMVVFVHPETNKITGKLMRFDQLNFSAMRKFHPGNIETLRSFTKSGWHEVSEQAKGLYTERDAEYNEVPVFAQNPANLNPSGRNRRTTTFRYPFVPNRDLCFALLVRDSALVSVPLYAFSILTNRDGADVLPGDFVTVSHPDYSLLNLPMRVVSVRKQDINYNNVSINLKQAKFPDFSQLVGPGSNTYDPGFDVSPKTPNTIKVITAPYYMVRAATGMTGSTINPVNFPMFLVKPINDFQASFDAYLNNRPGTASISNIVEGSTYATYAELTAPIDRYDNFADGIIPSLVIDTVSNSVNLVSVGLQGVKDGKAFLFINNEIMSFESATDNNDGTWTLTNVHRGLLDTVAGNHLENDRVYIIQNNFNAVSKQSFAYPIGYVPEWSIVGNGVLVAGRIEDALVSTDWGPSSLRTLSPPRPHDTNIGGVRGSSPVAITEGASVTVNWKARSRLSAAVALQDDAAETPEVNGSETQKFRVMHRSGVTITDIGTVDYTGNSATFTMPNVTDGAGFIFVESFITLGGVEYVSVYRDELPVTISP